MLKVLLRKICTLALSLAGISLAAFFLMKLLPGDPFLDERMTPEALQALRIYYGLDRPLWVQYTDYLGSFARGEFGLSLAYPGRTVRDLIASAFPVSARLGLQALLLALPAGLLAGVYAALRQGTWRDHGLIALTTLGIAVPNFVLAACLQYLAGVKLGLLPVALWGTFQHTILPTLALAALPAAFIARLVKASLSEALRQDYLKTALAKGLSPLQAALRHGLRGSLLPVVSYLGPVSAQILTGSFAVEKVFAIPGLGSWLIHSILGRDYPVILGITLFYGALLLIAAFLADILYSLLDPRVRYVS